MYYLQNTNRLTKCYAFFVIEDTSSNFSLILEKICQHALDRYIPKNYRSIRSLNFQWAYLSPSGAHMSYQNLQHANHPSLILPHQHDIINVIINVMLCGMSR